MKGAIARFAAQLFGGILAFIVTMGVMIYGWGLEPQSWWWIIGGGIVIRGLIFTMQILASKGE